MAMRPLNSIDESTNKNIETVNSSKWDSASKLKDSFGKIEEVMWSDTQTPNPKKAPLNYIDNMCEWEDAQKKYEEKVFEMQQKLAAVFQADEDKINEIEKFRNAKIDLDIELEKIMWAILNKLDEYGDFLKQVYAKIYQSEAALENVNSEQWWEVNGEVSDETDDKVEAAVDDEINDEESDNNWENVEENWEITVEPKTIEDSDLASQVANMLIACWLNVWWVSLVPMGELEWNWDAWLEAEVDAMDAVNEFLDIVDPENWGIYKWFLDKDEIIWVENLFDSIKWYATDYWKLQYQIDNIERKISKLEAEEDTIYDSYTQLIRETKTINEDMEDLNKTYFLNSYLSTKNVSFDSFVSSELVEKQIANIIELNKQWKPIPKTILLYWKSNLWKTYAANVLASELWRKMYHIKSYDIFTGWLSDPNAMLDAIFTWAIKMKEPCIIFLDEIEDFSCGDNWWPYQNLVENTIRHHISKIKDSSLDIMIIWAISNRNKVGSSLMKQDVFSKQIYFAPLSPEKYSKLFQTMLSDKGVKVRGDFNVESLIDCIKNSDRDQEYLKKLIDMAIDFHQLNHTDEVDNIVLSSDDFNDAIKFMKDYSHNVSQGVWYNSFSKTLESAAY